MKYAIVNGIRVEATKGVKGICPSCSSELIAKCGQLKINHWAHKGARTCDPWWEPETEWHRTWKNHYPSEWQEFSFRNKNEVHIADIHTDHALTIEFQHSHIDPKEKADRERFYKKMIWVVDGTRLKRDYSRFLKASTEFKIADKKGLFKVDYSNEIFPSNWLNSSVPVIFDFKGIEHLSDKNDKRQKLYCLFPIRSGRYLLLAEFSRATFIKSTITGEWSKRYDNFMESLFPSKAQTKPQEDIITKPKQREGTHYYDQKKGRFLKKWRF